MISKLSPWVGIGGFFLALIAGSVNAIGILGFAHEAVSHLSGTATLLAISASSNTPSPPLHLAGIMLSFLIGAMVSGILIGDQSLQLGRRYGWALALESALLLASMFALNAQSTSGHFFASAACGLQNAMATTYSGAVIRTTHVTGLFTDLGLLLGHWLRGTPFQHKKAILLSMLIAGFVCGGVVGTLLYRSFAYSALLFPALGCLSLAIAYSVIKLVLGPQIVARFGDDGKPDAK